jgi:spore coat polysaccharide biosynthesis protein SpsF
MGSTRLPQKVLADLAGMPMLGHIIERLKSSTRLNEIVVATTRLDSDDVIEELAYTYGVEVYRGSENDILGRLAGAVRDKSADILASVTGDNPYIDGRFVDDAIAFREDGGYDYVGSTHMQHSDHWHVDKTFPSGISVQVVAGFAVVEEDGAVTGIEARALGLHAVYGREDDKYSRGAFQAEGRYASCCHPDLRLTVDTADDLTLARKVYGQLHPRNALFSTIDAINLVASTPELKAINAGTVQRSPAKKQS